MPKFRKKPVVIEAMKLEWATWSEMCEFLGPGFFASGGQGVPGPDGAIGLTIPTLEGVMTAGAGDFIIRGVKGELYPCKADIFAATYEVVES